MLLSIGLLLVIAALILGGDKLAGLVLLIISVAIVIAIPVGLFALVAIMSSFN